jgi:hypothetical protein
VSDPDITGQTFAQERPGMGNIICRVSLIVIVMAVLSFIGPG